VRFLAAGAFAAVVLAGAFFAVAMVIKSFGFC